MTLRKIGFVFPGQGSQMVGMGKDLYENLSSASGRFAEAAQIVGFDLADICFNGPQEDLTKTSVAQPGLFTVSSILVDELIRNGIDARVVAGHSLGEYSALYAAGVFDYRTGLGIVDKRAVAMNKATQSSKGTMAAIIGLELAQVEALCVDASQHGIVGIANINSPVQIVISGEESGVSQAIELAKKEGAKRAIVLPVSGAFHSPLMQPVREELQSVIENANLQDPKVKFIANVSGDFVSDAAQIKNLLLAQITGSVRWVESVKKMIGEGVDTIIEIGPGKVLAGLIKRIDKSVAIFNISDQASLASVIEQVGE